MTRTRSLLTLTVIITLVTLPTAVSLLWYAITKNPSVRPLGITVSALRAFSGAEGLEIIAVVDWDDARSGQVTRADIQTALINAFKAKGVDVRVRFQPSNRGTFVSYKVGPSTIGPYPQSHAAEGISAAVEAYRLNTPYSP